MTMVPSAHHQNLSRQQQQQHPHLYGGYGGCGANYYNNTAPDDESVGGLLMSQVEEGGYDQYSYNNTITDQSYLLASSDLVVVNGPMAEDESRTNNLNNEAEAEAGSSSKAHVDEDQTDERWLQLSIGGHTASSADVQAPERRSSLRGSSSASGLIELDLLSANISSPSSSSSRQFQLQQAAARSSMTPMFHVPDHHHHQIRVPNFGMSTTSNLYFQHPGFGMGMGMGMSSSMPPSFHQHQHQEVNRGFRPLIPHHHNNHIGNSSASTSTSSSSFIQLGLSSSTSYFARPFQLQHHHLHHGGGAAPSLDFRVVDPPRRPQSGIWFMLQASQNQEKEPFLPQIPKSYLRIKDGRMTVRLIKKYLVNKLSLDSESEVEITCRGQQLLPFLTLQHVRDNIWSLRDAAASLTLLPLPDLSSCTSTSTTTDDHVMVLHYARTSSSSTTA
ncbi:hypothetical protein ACLB2K_037049 [Fragaria x ananassa]